MFRSRDKFGLLFFALLIVDGYPFMAAVVRHKDIDRRHNFFAAALRSKRFANFITPEERQSRSVSRGRVKSHKDLHTISRSIDIRPEQASTGNWSGISTHLDYMDKIHAQEGQHKRSIAVCPRCKANKRCFSEKRNACVDQHNQYAYVCQGFVNKLREEGASLTCPPNTKIKIESHARIHYLTPKEVQKSSSLRTRPASAGAADNRDRSNKFTSDSGAFAIRTARRRERSPTRTRFGGVKAVKSYDRPRSMMPKSADRVHVAFGQRLHFDVPCPKCSPTTHLIAKNKLRAHRMQQLYSQELGDSEAVSKRRSAWIKEPRSKKHVIEMKARSSSSKSKFGKQCDADNGISRKMKDSRQGCYDASVKKTFHDFDVPVFHMERAQLAADKHIEVMEVVEDNMNKLSENPDLARLARTYYRVAHIGAALAARARENRIDPTKNDGFEEPDTNGTKAVRFQLPDEACCPDEHSLQDSSIISSDSSMSESSTSSSPDAPPADNVSQEAGRLAIRKPSRVEANDTHAKKVSKTVASTTSKSLHSRQRRFTFKTISPSDLPKTSGQAFLSQDQMSALQQEKGKLMKRSTIAVSDPARAKRTALEEFTKKETYDRIFSYYSYGLEKQAPPRRFTRIGFDARKKEEEDEKCVFEKFIKEHKKGCTLPTS